MSHEVIVIGGGISGLAVAEALLSRGKDVLVLEEGAQAGGVIQSFQAEGFLIERGPNSLRGTPDLLRLIREFSLQDKSVNGDPHAPAYVFVDDKLQAVPMGPGPLLKTSLLTSGGKLRLFAEPFIKGQRSEGEESVASFIRRRLGPQVLDHLVSPFVSGIYAGDVNRLSVQAAFPKLAEFEDLGGSIIRGAIKHARSNKGPRVKRDPELRKMRMCSFRDGLQTLPSSIANQLGSRLKTGTRVTGIRCVDGAEGSGYEVTCESGGDVQKLMCRKLVMATPAFIGAKLLKGVSSELAYLLEEVPYASIASVPLGYRLEDIPIALDGFGFLIPRGTGYRILGTIWNSSLFEGRSPEGWALLTTYIGGATDPAATGLSDEALREAVHADLVRTIGVKGLPRALPITRWEKALPQYEIGHASRLKSIESLLTRIPGLAIAGNYLHGISLGDCLENGAKIAESLFQETVQVKRPGDSGER